jgi:integral membrane sensor domain MASE1
MRALLVGVACFLSTETVAFNLPPLFVSPVWPTNAILLCALVVTPVRHWWAFALAGFFSSVNHNWHTGASVSDILHRLVADAFEVVIATLGLRRFAGVSGVRQPTQPRCLSDRRRRCALRFRVRGSPLRGAEDQWSFWRSWFLGDAFGYLTLAPALLTWISVPWTSLGTFRGRNIESQSARCRPALTAARVFTWPTSIETNTPALMYLPLPFLLWATVRFGPCGATASIAIVTVLAMSATLRGTGRSSRAPRPTTCFRCSCS